MKRKKVAFIIQHLTNGGAERTISNLSLELSKSNEITLLVFDGKNVTYPYEGKLIDINIPPKDGVINKVLNVIRRAYLIKKIRKKEKFDCVISFMFGANIVNVLSKCGERVIISARNYISMYGLSKSSVFRERYIAKNADLEIGLSKAVSYDLIHSFKIPKNKVMTIYNPCNIERIQKLAEMKCEYIFDKDIFYVITAGRFVKQKGQWHLLKAFSLFNKKAPNSRLIILGDGELKDELDNLTKKLGIEKYVDYMGFVDNPYSYISRASCFVLSSLFEGLGNVIIESMACKTPVISYDCLAGPRELIAPETNINYECKEIEICSCGILVEKCGKEINFSTEIEKEDVNLSRAIETLYYNINLKNKIVKNAYKHLEEFSPNKIVKQWENII